MHASGLQLRGSVMASALGPMALEAALANFANSGLNMPELTLDEDDSGELHIRSVFQASPGADRKAAAGGQASKIPLRIPTISPAVSKDVRVSQTT